MASCRVTSAAYGSLTNGPGIREAPERANPGAGVGGAAPGLPPGPCENPRPTKRRRRMDIEQVNAIGTLLADLSRRTEQLRGYL